MIGSESMSLRSSSSRFSTSLSSSRSAEAVSSLDGDA